MFPMLNYLLLRAFKIVAFSSVLIGVVNANPLYASAALNANAKNDIDWVTDPHSITFNDASAFQDFTLSSSATVPGVHTEAQLTTSWGLDGNSGTLQVGDGWAIGDSGGYASFYNEGSFFNWSYLFTADFDGKFRLNYSLKGSGDLFGLYGWEMAFTGLPSNQLLGNPFDPNMIGQFSSDLVAGQTYFLGLRLISNITGGANNNAWLDSNFNFDIVPDSATVPEPSTLGLIGLAMGGLFAARRGKRRTCQ